MDRLCARQVTVILIHASNGDVRGECTGVVAAGIFVKTSVTTMFIPWNNVELVQSP